MDLDRAIAVTVRVHVAFGFPGTVRERRYDLAVQPFALREDLVDGGIMVSGPKRSRTTCSRCSPVRHAATCA